MTAQIDRLHVLLQSTWDPEKRAEIENEIQRLRALEARPPTATEVMNQMSASINRAVEDMKAARERGAFPIHHQAGTEAEFRREVMEPNDEILSGGQAPDPLFAPTPARLPYGGKSKVGYSEAGQEQQEKDDAEGGATGYRQASTLAALEHQGTEGITIAELCTARGWHHGQASGALSTLNKTGEIVRLARGKRGGQSVYVLPEFIDGREVAVRRTNPNVVVVGEPEVRHQVVEVEVARSLSPGDAEFVAEIAEKINQNRDRGVLPFKVSTLERLLGVISGLTKE